MSHHTKDKGDIALTKTIADLTVKGFGVYLPLNEHLPVDLIATKEDKLFRIQVKYSKNGNLNNKTSWSDKNGSHVKQYGDNDFDYFALYLPQIDKIVYPSIQFGGARIRFSPTKSATPYYWYEDFLEFTDEASKRNYKDFGIKLIASKKQLEIAFKTRRVVHPTKEELEKLLWEMPTTHLAKKFGVSDVAIKKWAKAYQLEFPPRGYWAKKYAGKL